MEYSEWIATTMSLVSLAVVFWELRQGRKQNRTGALIQIYDINRQLLGMGFDRPEFFCAIGGTSGEGETVRRYLQLWLNQIALIVHLNDQGLLTRSQWHSLEVDIECLFETSELKNLWSDFRPFYPEPLRSFLDGKVAAIEAKEKAEVSRVETSAA
ncbi:MAG: hypothetical protein ACJAQT_000076 [Akkermansiaceae bacterium]